MSSVNFDVKRYLADNPDLARSYEPDDASCAANVKAAAMALNAAISHALRAGLRVEIDVVEMQSIVHPSGPLVEVRVSRPL